MISYPFTIVSQLSFIFHVFNPIVLFGLNCEVLDVKYLTQMFFLFNLKTLFNEGGHLTAYTETCGLQ